MVRAMKRYYGKGPVNAKSYLVDDLLFVVMRDGLSQAERTMVQADRPETVREFRREFTDLVADHLMRTIERLTGRHVISYQSQVLFDPDMTIETFLFDDRPPGDRRRRPGTAG
jgi:uncharacterized protein YbcI